MALVSVDADGRPDGEWRVDPRGAGEFDLTWKRALVLHKVSLDRVVDYMLRAGADPGQLVDR